LQIEPQIVAYGHVRVERVALEDHGHIAVPRRDIRHIAPTQRDGPGGDRFQPGDHTQRRRLAAAGRTKQGEELAILDLQIETAHGDRLGAVDLGHVCESDRHSRETPIAISPHRA
jgi:hypothetical protein